MLHRNAPWENSIQNTECNPSATTHQEYMGMIQTLVYSRMFLLLLEKQMLAYEFKMKY